MTVVISDTPLLLDLEHSLMMEKVMDLPIEFAVCDALYETEIQGSSHEELLGKTLRIETLDEDELLYATALRRSCRSISVSDSFALAMGEKRRWPLLVGGSHLQAEGRRRGIECRDLSWLIRELERAGAAATDLLTMLERLTPRCRCTLAHGEFEQLRAAIRGSRQT
jgi:hypothetical protein